MAGKEGAVMKLEQQRPLNGNKGPMSAPESRQKSLRLHKGLRFLSGQWGSALQMCRHQQWQSHPQLASASPSPVL